MDLPLDIGSQTAAVRAVALAESYVSYIAAPDLARSVTGAPLDTAMQGYILDDISAENGGQTAAVFDPKTGQPVHGPDGQPLRVVYRAGATGGKLAPGLNASVAWRTPVGVRLQFPGDDAAVFMQVMRHALPAVNTVRLDLNAATLRDPAKTKAWREVALAAAAQGLRLIVVNVDGRYSGNYVPLITSGPDAGATRMPLALIGPADALTTATPGDWLIRETRDEWEAMLTFLARPENEPILKAVWGWELMNEPMAYGKTVEAGRIYSQHMHDLIADPKLAWGDKRILVGGLGASTRFSILDQDLIRQAAGQRLIWSAHMYPNWVTASGPDASQRKLIKTFRRLIAPVRGDMLVTETMLPGNESLMTPLVQKSYGWNWARGITELGDHGIGMTWWPVTSRKSTLLLGDPARWRVTQSAVAFAQLAWLRDETPPDDPEGQRHTGTAGADYLAVAPPGANMTGLTQGLADNHGVLFGLGGADTLVGHPSTDMLYGGTDNDQLSGGDGNDFLFGGPGVDEITGDAGNDLIFDVEGDNRIQGGPGNDEIEGTGQLAGGPGNDTLAAAYAKTARLTGDEGADLFRPAQQGRTTITDFDPTQDRIDLTLWSAQPKTRGLFRRIEHGAVALANGRGGELWLLSDDPHALGTALADRLDGVGTLTLTDGLPPAKVKPPTPQSAAAPARP